MSPQGHHPHGMGGMVAPGLLVLRRFFFFFFFFFFALCALFFLLVIRIFPQSSWSVTNTLSLTRIRNRLRVKQHKRPSRIRKC
jgi:hypothetical protein